MVSGFEKREYRRLPVRLDLSCRKLGSTVKKPCAGRTTDVSTGGLYFKTAETTFEEGNLVKIKLEIPPTPGLLEFGGTISAFATVTRITAPNQPSPATAYGIALQFSRPPKLSG